MYRTVSRRITGHLHHLPGEQSRGVLLRINLSCLIIIISILLSACAPEKRQHEYTIFSFGTLIDITLYDVDENLAHTAFEHLQHKFDEYHQQWSPWTNGDLAQLNLALSETAPVTSENRPIDVPSHLIPLIRTSITLSKQSDSYFNPAIGRLINLWQFHKYQDKGIRPPSVTKIQELLKQNPQMSDLSFNEQGKLINKNPAVLLNFGAYAKGYAIKLATGYLKGLGINNAIVNAGGDLSVIGQHGDRAWNIGIRHPRKDTILASIEVSNDESVFTSGDYERFYYYGGKRYHHILNPETGYPSKSVQSVTVLHHDAAVADAAATALFVAGSDNWQRVAKQMAIDLVMLIDDKGNIQLTPAMQKRVKFLDKSPTSNIIISR